MEKEWFFCLYRKDRKQWWEAMPTLMKSFPSGKEAKVPPRAAPDRLWEGPGKGREGTAEMCFLDSISDSCIHLHSSIYSYVYVNIHTLPLRFPWNPNININVCVYIYIHKHIQKFSPLLFPMKDNRDWELHQSLSHIEISEYIFL